MVQFLFSISMFIFWRTIRAPKKTGLSKPRPRWASLQPRHGMGFVLSNDVAKFIAEMSKKLPLRQATAWRKQWTRDLETFETICRYLGGGTSSVNWIYPHFTEKPFETPPEKSQAGRDGGEFHRLMCTWSLTLMGVFSWRWASQSLAELRGFVGGYPQLDGLFRWFRKVENQLGWCQVVPLF